VTKINFFSIEQLVVTQLVNKSLIFHETLKILSRILDFQSAESSPETPFFNIILIFVRNVRLS
jgi:hypothetical protein